MNRIDATQLQRDAGDGGEKETALSLSLYTHIERGITNIYATHSHSLRRLR